MYYGRNSRNKENLRPVFYTDKVAMYDHLTSTGHVTVCISYTAENIFDDISYHVRL